MKIMSDMTGREFGTFRVIEFCGKDRHNHPLWKCVCACGIERVVPGYRLLTYERIRCKCNKNKPVIHPAKKVCPYSLCRHNILFQLFNTDKEPVATDWVKENGACMLAISEEEKKAGVAGMRREQAKERLRISIRSTCLLSKELRAERSIRSGGRQGLRKETMIEPVLR